MAWILLVISLVCEMSDDRNIDYMVEMDINNELRKEMYYEKKEICMVTKEEDKYPTKPVNLIVPYEAKFSLVIGME